MEAVGLSEDISPIPFIGVRPFGEFVTDSKKMD
jgi:hypothetical protein